MAVIERDEFRRPLRIRVHHHGDDAVEAKIILRGREFKRVRCPPLRAMRPDQAADVVARFVTDINEALQRALDADESRGPTNAPADG